MRLPRCWPRGRPRARTAGRCRARRRGCALHTHTQRRGASQTVSRTVYTRNPLSRAAHGHAPVALAASGLDQAVSIAGSRSLQGQGARSSETHDTGVAHECHEQSRGTRLLFRFRSRSIPPVLQWARPEGYEASLHTRASSINVYAGYRPVQWRGSGAKKRRSSECRRHGVLVVR